MRSRWPRRAANIPGASCWSKGTTYPETASSASATGSPRPFRRGAAASLYLDTSCPTRQTPDARARSPGLRTPFKRWGKYTGTGFASLGAAEPCDILAHWPTPASVSGSRPAPRRADTRLPLPKIRSRPRGLGQTQFLAGFRNVGYPEQEERDVEAHCLRITTIPTRFRRQRCHSGAWVTDQRGSKRMSRPGAGSSGSGTAFWLQSRLGGT